MTKCLLSAMIVSLALLGMDSFRRTAAVEPTRIRLDQSSVRGENVDFFLALDAKLIDASFIPSDATKAKVAIRNLTKQPLAIALPRAFAAVPVLGQFGFPGGQGIGAQGGNGQGVLAGQNGGGIGAGGGSQALGGGFGQGQLGGGGGGIGLGNGGGVFGGGGIGGLNGGGGGGFFRIEPEKVRKIDVLTVCLEHGKPDPNARMKYRILPLQEFTTDMRIEALCAQLAVGNVSQKVAQAVAWNIANGLSWEALAAKDRKVSAYTGREKFFTKAELSSAIQLAAYCRKHNSKTTSKSLLKSAEFDDGRENQVNFDTSR